MYPGDVLSIASSVLISVLAILWLLVAIHSRIRANRILISYLPVYALAAFCWYGVLTLIVLNQDQFPQADALYHQGESLRVANLIHSGRWPEVMEYARPGNRAFQLLCGMLFFVTSADPFVIRILSVTAGLLGIICLTDIVTRMNGRRIPPTLLYTILLLPSFLFWSSDFLKDGFTMAFNCYIAQLLLLESQDQKFGPLSRTTGWGALILLTLFRPHHAIAWFAGLAIAPAIADRRYARAAAFSLLGMSAAYAFYLAVPELVEKMLDDGASNTLSSEYENRSDYGGSSIGGGKPIPFITGAILIIARPFPGEVPGAQGIVCSVEAMWFTLLTLTAIFKVRSYQALLNNQATMGALIATIAYFGVMSYIYNMGLMVRMRISVLPSLFMLIIPIIGGGVFLVSGSERIKTMTKSESYSRNHHQAGLSKLNPNKSKR